jgi:hypothetical protein
MGRDMCFLWTLLLDARYAAVSRVGLDGKAGEWRKKRIHMKRRWEGEREGWGWT